MRNTLSAVLFLSSFLATPALAVCTTSITAGPANPTSSTSASFSFVASGCGLGSLQCRLDGATYATCTSPKSYSNLSQGVHTFNTRHLGDLRGSVDTWSWTIDTTAPTTTITSNPPAYTNDPKPTFTFTSNEAGDFKCKVDSGTYATCTSPHTIALQAEGSHTFYVKAIDDAKNEDATPASYAFEVGRSAAISYSGMWLMTNAGLEQWGLDLTTGHYERVFVIDTANAKANAVDQGGENSWALAYDATLRSYSFDGVQQLSVTPPTTPSGGDTVGLVVDNYDGSVRLGFGTKLYHYSESGTLVRTTTLSSALKALGIDYRLGVTVAVMSSSIIGLNRDGSTAFTISAANGTGVAVDQMTGEFWISYAAGMSYSGALKQYSSAGTELGSVSTSSSTVTAIRADGLGGVWAVTGNNLKHYDAAFAQRLSIDPFGSAISAIEASPFDGRTWVATSTSARLYSFAGSVDSYRNAESSIKSIAFARSNSPALGAFDGRDSWGVMFGAGATYLEVTSVWRGSPAEAAGLELGDELLSINGVTAPSPTFTVQNWSDFLDNAKAARSGGSDDFSMRRGGSPLAINNVAFEDYGTVLRTGVRIIFTEATNAETPAGECKACFPAPMTGGGAGDPNFNGMRCQVVYGGEGCTEKKDENSGLWDCDDSNPPAKCADGAPSSP